MHSGFLNIYKPSGVSSAAVLNRLKYGYGFKKIGHGGTLDPLAEGVLPVAIGKATRLLNLLASEKTYRSTFILGAHSDTNDITGEVVWNGVENGRVYGEAQIAKALEPFKGKIDQVVPLYSAVHVNGKRLYKLARAGEIVEALPSKSVTVFRLDLLAVRSATHDGTAIIEIDIEMHCAAGTYVRSIARDLGEALGCGGLMKTLLRTQACGMYVQDAVLVEETGFLDLFDRAYIAPPVLIDGVDYVLAPDEFTVVTNGNILATKRIADTEQPIFCLWENKILAVGTYAKGELRPKVVFEVPKT